MKTLLLTLIAMTGISVQAQQAPAEVSCYNNMYRESIFRHSPNYILSISDSHASGIEPILKKISADHNLGYLITRSVQLDIPREDIECQSVGAFPLSCEGSSKNATLHVSATFIGGEISLALKVPLKNLALKASLANLGPIQLGSDTTVVGFQNYVVDLDADVVHKGVMATLSFKTFFYTQHASGDTKPLSNCEVYQP